MLNREDNWMDGKFNHKSSQHNPTALGLVGFVFVFCDKL